MYEEIAYKFVQHFMWIAYAMDRIGEHHDEMWDEEDGFFYDVLRLPDGQAKRLKVQVAGRPAAAVRVDGVRGRRSDGPSRAQGDDRACPEAASRSCSPTSPRPTTGSSATRTGVCSPFSTRRSWSSVLEVHARRERVPRAARHPVALSISPRSPVLVLGRSTRSTRCSTCRPNRTRACSAGTPTGAARSGCPSTC